MWSATDDSDPAKTDVCAPLLTPSRCLTRETRDSVQRETADSWAHSQLQAILTEPGRDTMRMPRCIILCTNGLVGAAPDAPRIKDDRPLVIGYLSTTGCDES